MTPTHTYIKCDRYDRHVTCPQKDMLSCIQVFFDIFVVCYVFASLVLCSKHDKQVRKNTRAYGQTSLSDTSSAKKRYGVATVSRID